MSDVELEITDNEFLRQFETTIDGQKAKIEYAQQERKIFLTKLIMSEEQIEKGYEQDFIIAVFNIIQDRNIRLVPTSPIIAKFMRKNRRKYKDLLPVGINI
ncbi:N-acetyltransferase [Aquimarina sp. AD10]|uniref:Acetyltransferase n=1 Tax=Aquimarina aggregata TaxID=1642818 RepID=A0A162Y697_9FLAO|nr:MULTISPECIES: N-acetyltransferase [Aquimarina]AXT63618.1 N-acetyltransferase [Aquimarina sp. AD10]KZS38949.1 acetyltransferase [Aquimarina aggregata]RKN00114.1 N-acetyltransferase [Aquimarina sp. AD10]